MSEKIENLLATKNRLVHNLSDVQFFIKQLSKDGDVKVYLSTPLKSYGPRGDFAQLEMHLNETLKEKFIEFLTSQVLSGMVQEDVAISETIAEIEKLIN